MKKIILIITLLTCFAGILLADDEARLQELKERLGIDPNRDFCGRKIIVFLEPWLSDPRKTLVNDSFFGTFDKLSVENITIFTEESVIQRFEERDALRGEKIFGSTFIITLPQDCKIKVLEAIEELRMIEGIYRASPNSFDRLEAIPTDPQYSTHWKNEKDYTYNHSTDLFCRHTTCR